MCPRFAGAANALATNAPEGGIIRPSPTPPYWNSHFPIMPGAAIKHFLTVKLLLYVLAVKDLETGYGRVETQGTVD